MTSPRRGGTSRAGRKGREPLGPTVGCDLGGTSVKVARLRGNRVQTTLEAPTPAKSPPALVVSTLADAIREACGSQDPDRSGPGSSRGLKVGCGDVAAVAVALPGFLDAGREVVLHLSNLPALDGVPLRRRLEGHLGVPVVLDTDTNAGALGEAVLGAGRAFHRVLYLTLGTGLGGALVIGREPVRVSRHTVGQVAHLPLDPSGPRCRCGDRGCAEAVLSARGILWRARRCGVRGVSTPRGLQEATREGQGTATRQVWREVGHLLGQLCLTLGALFSPDIVVVGGGIAGAAARFLPETRRVLRVRLARRLGREIPVEPAAQGPWAGAVGAALLARRALERR